MELRSSNSSHGTGKTNPLGNLPALAAELWQVASLPDLIRSLASIGKREFGLGFSGVYAVSMKGNRRSLRPSALYWDEDARFHEGLSRLISKAWGEEGLLEVCLDEEPCSWAVFDGQLGQMFVLVWAGRPNLPRDPLDFLVRQVQHQCRWFGLLDKTQRLLYHDDLTGLYNHRYLELAIDAELRRAQRLGTTFCLLFVDIDNFKKINDTMGHLAGSDVLRSSADLLRTALRDIDVMIRYGGDEFVVILVGATARSGWLAAERLRRHFESSTVSVGGKTVQLTVSVGVAAYPDHGKDRVALLQLADTMMYQSKAIGKNSVTMANSADARTPPSLPLPANHQPQGDKR